MPSILTIIYSLFIPLFIPAFLCPGILMPPFPSDGLSRFTPSAVPGLSQWSSIFGGLARLGILMPRHSYAAAARPP